MGISGNFWIFTKQVQDRFQFQGKRGFSLEMLSVKGTPQACRGEYRSLRGIVAGILGLLLNCVSSWVTTHVSSGKSDLLWNCEGPLGFLVHRCRDEYGLI